MMKQYIYVMYGPECKCLNPKKNKWSLCVIWKRTKFLYWPKICSIQLILYIIYTRNLSLIDSTLVPCLCIILV